MDEIFLEAVSRRPVSAYDRKVWSDILLSRAIGHENWDEFLVPCAEAIAQSADRLHV